MKAAEFAAQIIECMALPAEQRHARLAALHTTIFEAYTAAVQAITPEQAARPVQLGAETRTLAQVVGHITAWERFLVLGAGDVLAGIHHPRMTTSLAGYQEPDGQAPEFASIDSFNAYQAEKQAALSWAAIQAQALDTASIVYALFTDARLLNAARLEETRTSPKRLQDGTRLGPIPTGWHLWLVALEHEGVEHAAELGLE